MTVVSVSGTSSTDATSEADALPQEEQVRIIPGGKASRLQNLTVSVLTAFYFGAQSASEKQPPRAMLERLENETAIVIREVSGAQAVDAVLKAQSLEDLHDGMTLKLGAHIAAYLSEFGDTALEDLARVALQAAAHEEALSHAMRWIGRLSTRQSAHSSVLMLSRSLEAPSAVVRDGAALGLVDVGSPAALQALEAAIGRETIPALREDFEQAARYLRTRT